MLISRYVASSAMAVVFRYNKYLYPAVECVVDYYYRLGGRPVPVSEVIDCMEEKGYRGIRNIYSGLEAAIQDGYVTVEYSKNGRGKRRLYVPTLLGAVDAGIYKAVAEALYGEGVPSLETVKAIICSMRGVIFWVAVRGLVINTILATILKRLMPLCGGSNKCMELSDEIGSRTLKAIEYSVLFKAIAGIDVRGLRLAGIKMGSLPLSWLSYLMVAAEGNAYQIVLGHLVLGDVKAFLGSLSWEKNVEGYLQALIGEGYKDHPLTKELEKTYFDTLRRARHTIISLARFARNQWCS